MEINEKNLLTPEEATLLRSLMSTAVNHSEKIVEQKLKQVRESIKSNPDFKYVELLCGIGSINVDDEINNIVEKKRKEMMAEMEVSTALAASILSKIPSLVNR